MVVDDEKVFISLVTEHLKEMGFTDIKSAASGDEALWTIASQKTPFDCFLLDIKMDGMDGIQLCARIRALPEYRAAPIIMITSASAKKYMQEAFDAGATDYLAKPIEALELRARIQIAMLLVETLQREAESQNALQALLKTTSDDGEFDQGTRIVFSEIKSMRDYFQLENRLLRLSDSPYAMTLLSIEVTGLEILFKRRKKNKLVTIIHSVAQILDKTIPSSGATFSYVGYGKFICLIVVRNQIVPKLLQARIRDAFEVSLTELGQLDFSELQLDVTALSQERMLSPRVAIGLIRRYIGSLGARRDMLLPPISKTQDRLFKELKYAQGKTE